MIMVLLLLKFLVYQDRSVSWWQFTALLFCTAFAVFFWWQILFPISKTIAIVRYVNYVVVGFGAMVVLANGFLVFVSPAVLYDRTYPDLDQLLTTCRYWHSVVEIALTLLRQRKGSNKVQR